MSCKLLFNGRTFRSLSMPLLALPLVAAAEPVPLGEHPLCEASAAVLVPCPDAPKQRCLLVGDNEERTSLFLFRIEGGKVQREQQQVVTLDLDSSTELSDIEALTRLPGDQIGVFASHSRNTKCKARKKRRRFGRISELGPASTAVALVETKRLGCDRVIDACSGGDPLLAAVCVTIESTESRADAVEEGFEGGTLDEATAKKQCNEVLPYNAEGAVNLIADGQPDLWIGLRAPLLSRHPSHPEETDLAILLHMKDLDAYVFDRVALLDMDGRGVRDLTVSEDSVWLIAGPPEDLPEGAEIPFQLRRFDVSALSRKEIIEPELIDPDLPTSSEGLVILDGQAIVVMDGDAGEDAEKCAKPSRIDTRPLSASR